MLDNTTRMGECMRANLRELQERHAVIGDVRGLGLFCGAELVSDRQSKIPVEEKQVQAVIGACMADGVIIGATNRSLPGLNNTLCFSPALIATAAEIDTITSAVDRALTKVFGRRFADLVRRNKGSATPAGPLFSSVRPADRGGRGRAPRIG
ncbi:aminotransferase class III-fold pyridoxal phosphate-dependent enzyme [Rhizobium laguerreae]|uniref:aminotransferase class III-fold pyridoxal phosphate-dependent enzyme n=1 Tax=Rhizobium laguerreae TaxID=1076926 RepID=UPI001C8FEEF3|nr:aminotransferase class III-fold pyridoxal phosphate-dependent enzyme [Rhizobium laguerreae]MBY3088891.1 aminotransferase class III-fold pyridoxal phosphate-dependent enzyme [Rhizobium laguerreae]MBY3150599.1 aminotransferase class III-fold pyridoxal phosphate-dependent enzyme [Rhizobium laguerreae]